MPILVEIILGAILLFAGCEIFWLFLGIAGFIAGFKLAQIYLPSTSPMVTFAIAGGSGLIGIFITLFFQTAAIALAGFMAGIYLVFSLFGSLGGALGLWQPVLILFGGILGAALMVAYFDWALISLSSLAGAALIAEVIPVNFFFKAIIFCILVIVGLTAQSTEKNAHTKPPEGNKKSRLKE